MCEHSLALCLKQQIELSNPSLDLCPAGSVGVRVVVPRSAAVVDIAILLQEHPAHNRKSCSNIGAVYVAR
eukprot:4962215-Prymnesium_polylepis.2